MNIYTFVANCAVSLMTPGGAMWFSASRRTLVLMVGLYSLSILWIWSQLSHGFVVFLLFLSAMPIFNIAVLFARPVLKRFTLRRYLLSVMVALFHAVFLIVLLQGDRIISLVLGERVDMLEQELIRVESVSMLPTLHPGELMLVTSVRADRDLVCVGDIVVFRQWEASQTLLVKRVVAVAGQWARYTDEGLVIESKRRRRIVIPATSKPSLSLRSTYQVPPYSVYVLGDNPKESSDSRIFGAIPFSRIVGKVRYALALRSFSELALGQSLETMAECVGDHGGQ